MRHSDEVKVNFLGGWWKMTEHNMWRSCLKMNMHCNGTVRYMIAISFLHLSRCIRFISGVWASGLNQSYSKGFPWWVTNTTLRKIFVFSVFFTATSKSLGNPFPVWSPVSLALDCNVYIGLSICFLQMCYIIVVFFFFHSIFCFAICCLQKLDRPALCVYLDYLCQVFLQTFLLPVFSEQLLDVLSS